MINAAQIMIVEDEGSLADKLRVMLENIGHHVVGITDSKQNPIEKAIILKADLILMDLMAAYNASFDTAINLRVKPSLENNKTNNRIETLTIQNIPPFIFLTSFTNDNISYNDLIKTGIPSSYLLKKPFTKSQLKRAIESALCKYPNKRYINANGYFDRSGANKLLIGDDRIIKPQTVKEKPHSLFSNILGKYSKELICLISELKMGDIAELSLNLLIKVCYELALVNVRKKISRIANINKRWELSVEDIAVESICNLFIKNSKRKRLNLECFALNWSDKISDNTDALFFLNKIVSISIDQYMNKLFRNSDPFFAKILDAFSLAIKNLNYSKIDHFGKVYIVKDGDGYISSDKIIPSEEFMSIPLDHYTGKKEILKYLMNYIELNTGYFPAIPLNLLVERYMEYNSIQYTAEPLSDFERISIDDIIFSSLEKTIGKMKRTYLMKKKINSNEADQIASALTDIAFDFREGNTIENLADYLEVYIKGLSIEEYKRRYRNIFEYLVKVFKKSIAGKLKR
ncbi:MAG: hypothetical protein ACM34K_12570 [Bacillota bacterium]